MFLNEENPITIRVSKEDTEEQMKNAATLMCLLLAFCSNSVVSQQPLVIDYLSRTLEYGSASGIAIGPDGTVFSAYGSGGLRAYRWTDTSMVRVALIDQWPQSTHVTLNDVAVRSDGIVFATNGNFGLSAFLFDGRELHHLATTAMSWAHSVAVGNDGIVYVTDTKDYLLRAYEFDGTVFSEAGSIGTWERPRDLTVGSDGTVFLTRISARGLCAYEHSGNNFVKIDSFAVNGAGGYFGVAVSPNGTVFWPHAEDGLTILRYNDHRFESILRSDMFAGPVSPIEMPNGDILFAIASDGIRLCKFSNGRIDSVASFTSADSPSIAGMVLTGEGRILSAEGYQGVAVYEAGESSIRTLARCKDAGNAKDVYTNRDGVIFLANAEAGLYAYRFESGSFTLVSKLYNGHSVDAIIPGRDSVLFMRSGYAAWACIYSGDTLRIAGQTAEKAYQIAADETGILYACDRSYLRAYDFDESGFHVLDETVEQGITAIAVRSDGVLFAASQRLTGPTSDREDLHVYRFEDSTFRKIATVRTEVYADYITFDEEGIAFVGGNAYRLAGDSITQLQHPGGPMGSNLLWADEHTCFLSANLDGLVAYHYDSLQFSVTGQMSGMFVYNADLYPGNILILANGNEGMSAYKYSRTLGLADIPGTAQAALTQHPNYPNPFHSSTTISFTLNRESSVTIEITDLLGRIVGSIRTTDIHRAGTHRLTFNARDLPQGLYLCRIEALGTVSTQSILLAK